MNDLSFKETDFLQRHQIPIGKFQRARKILNDNSSDIMPEWVHKFIMELVSIINTEVISRNESNQSYINPDEAIERFFRELKGESAYSESLMILHEP